MQAQSKDGRMDGVCVYVLHGVCVFSIGRTACDYWNVSVWHQL